MNIKNIVAIILSLLTYVAYASDSNNEHLGTFRGIRADELLGVDHLATPEQRSTLEIVRQKIDISEKEIVWLIMKDVEIRMPYTIHEKFILGTYTIGSVTKGTENISVEMFYTLFLHDKDTIYLSGHKFERVSNGISE